MRIALAHLACMVAVCGCAPKPPAPPAPPSAPPAESQLPFVGRVWLSSDFGKPRGTIRIFLPDGTLVMDSCFETFRVVEWRAWPDNKIVWREESVPVEAEVAQPSPDALRLTIRLPRETIEENYTAATAPYVCPDMPR